MRSAHPLQPALPLALISNKHAKKLAAIAQVLDGLPQLEAHVLDDLVRPQVRRDTGRQGLSAQQVLRTLVLYLLLQVDFEQLEFHLADSPTVPPTALSACSASARRLPSAPVFSKISAASGPRPSSSCIRSWSSTRSPRASSPHTPCASTRRPS